MTNFYFVVATVPFALYLFALTIFYCRRSPVVVDGRGDFVALATSAIGFFFIGPGQIMAPWGACAVWHSWVWILVAAFYILLSSIVANFARQKIVVYNVRREALRKTLTTLALELDEEARWLGDAMVLPKYGAQFFLEYSVAGRVATLVRFGDDRSRAKWNELRRSLVKRLKGVSNAYKRIAFGFGLLGGALLGADAALIIKRSEEFLEALNFYLSV